MIARLRRFPAVAAAFLIGVAAAAMLPLVAQETGNQALLNLSWIGTGVSSQGARVLQTGEVNTLTALVATSTRTEVVAAPSAGSIYLRALLVEKSSGGTGTITITNGTGTNCGTGTATIAGPITNPPVGYIPLGILVPAANALCLQTDAATTGVRALVN